MQNICLLQLPISVKNALGKWDIFFIKALIKLSKKQCIDTSSPTANPYLSILLFCLLLEQLDWDQFLNHIAVKIIIFLH